MKYLTVGNMALCNLQWASILTSERLVSKMKDRFSSVWPQGLEITKADFGLVHGGIFKHFNLHDNEITMVNAVRTC